MGRDEPYLARSASAAVILPIVGMLGGLTLGATLASFWRTDGITGVAYVLRWGVTGFFLGLALIVLLSLSLRRKDLISLRRLMVLVLVAGLLCWYFARILFGIIGY